MTDNEKLIEEAAKAINTSSSHYGPEWSDIEDRQKDRFRHIARAALAVFEKAHTPTDDEREAQGWREAGLYAVDSVSQDDFMTGWRTADRLRRSEVPEPSADHMDALSRIDQAVAYIRASWLGMGEPTPNTPAGEIIAILRGVRTFTPEPQGEPSDAQVEAAWAVLERDGLTVLERSHVRAALRAAGEVKPSVGSEPSDTL